MRLFNLSVSLYVGGEMYRKILWISLTIAVFSNSSIAAETYRLEMSLSDAFLVSETDDWNVEVERYLMLRSADVKITSKDGYDFNMKLFFKADTKDLALFDTPKKIEQSVLRSTENYLPYTVEKQITLNPVPLPQTFGYYAVITDAELASVSHVPTGEYRYITRGMYRASEDTALGFSVMTNDISSGEYKSLLAYIYSFLKIDAPVPTD